MKSQQIHKILSEGGGSSDSRQELAVRRRQTGAQVVTEPCSGPGASEVLGPGLKKLSFLRESHNKGASDASGQCTRRVVNWEVEEGRVVIRQGFQGDSSQN